ncbi:hypothetical protein AB5I39_10045 [Sphingomonas sp. MMS24-J45]|uniref:hypothetical protein n=1 Tax=Sphingomonas sp. MMS24-J45 TaxID=3238806 RepID=UPI00384AA8EF
MTLTDGSMPMQVLRREKGPRILRDRVLAGIDQSRTKWLAHWLIRLTALHGEIGLTTALILDGCIDPACFPCVMTLCREGAWVYKSSIRDATQNVASRLDRLTPLTQSLNAEGSYAQEYESSMNLLETDVVH